MSSANKIDLVHNDPGNPASRYGGWKFEARHRHEEHFERCSFCGSIKPQDLVAETSWRASWADQKYGWPHKFYVDIANREPDKLFVIGSSNVEHHAGDRVYNTWKNVSDLTKDEIAILDREYPDGKNNKYRPTGSVLFGTRPYHTAKFYTVHLADPEIPNDVKEEIMRISGIRFVFTERDGESFVSWSRYTVPVFETKELTPTPE